MFLVTQEAYTLHKRVKRRFLRRKMYLKGIADLYQAYLVDVSGIANYNDSYRYLLICIDVFTKRAWTIPLYSKTGREVTEAFGKILGLSDRLRLRMVQTDKSTEFINATFQRMLMVQYGK